ncbi:MAG: glucosamine-6-phosphate deaminase [Defluviitaleaceae bacterium]|nr:glucosamine-6-phosphate deaminase [Defluviitaleaceae bacterium]
MKIYRAKDYDHMSQIAANILAAQIVLKPDSCLGLATGGSPVGTYKKLIEKHKNGDLDFGKVVTINLDEYCGLSKDNDQSYDYYMREYLFNHVNINFGNVNIPNGLEPDAAKECKLYDEIIAKNPIDVQLLGIGTNGHIGFNEPSAEFKFASHHAQLAEATIEANKRYFDSEEKVPKTAYTMGIGQIMLSKKIVLIASGESKADIMYKALHGPIMPQLPASVLQMHRDVTVIGDEAALKHIKQ